MNILVAMDSFKGSLSSIEAGNAVKDGILSASSEHEVTILPLADGGEGTLSALTDGLSGIYKTKAVTGPDGNQVKARYGIVNGDTAIIEMAEASGLTLVEHNNIMSATSYGTGELIKDALDQGLRKYVICIGGSATNDGGTGLLSALGVRFLDSNGQDIPRGAIGLKDLKNIDLSGIDKRISESSFKVACDVTNPLLGINGCSYVYGPQKGATEAQIKDMDEWMRNFADLTVEVIPEADSNYPGSGAAGGVGFALKNYLGATLKSGSKLVFDVTGLAEQIKNADMLITGEGRIDGQSMSGKGPVEAGKIAKENGKKAVVFAGCEGDDAMMLLEVFDSYHILPEVENFMDRDVAYHNLLETVRYFFLTM